jgi:hypothetical protein
LANRPEINRAGLEASEVKSVSANIEESAPAGIEEKERVVNLLEKMLDQEHAWHSQYLTVQVCAWFALYADRAPQGKDIKQNDNSFKVEMKQWLNKHSEMPIETFYSKQSLSSLLWPLNFLEKDGSKYFKRIHDNALKEFKHNFPQ